MTLTRKEIISVWCALRFNPQSIPEKSSYQQLVFSDLSSIRNLNAWPAANGINGNPNIELVQLVGTWL
jgi:hypothetical protein